MLILELNKNRFGGISVETFEICTNNADGDTLDKLIIPFAISHITTTYVYTSKVSIYTYEFHVHISNAGNKRY